MKRFSISALLVVALINLFAVSADARQSTQTAFSPSPRAIALVIDTIASAEETIELAAYSFTSQRVTDALMEAHERGVDVRIVLDKGQTKRKYPAAVALLEAGVPIRINRRYAIMHNKYIIIDRMTVETGSFNYTNNAEKNNAENVLVIKNNRAVAEKYMEDWQRLWDEGEAWDVLD